MPDLTNYDKGYEVGYKECEQAMINIGAGGAAFPRPELFDAVAKDIFVKAVMITECPETQSRYLFEGKLARQSFEAARVFIEARDKFLKKENK